MHSNMENLAWDRIGWHHIQYPKPTPRNKEKGQRNDDDDKCIPILN